jgi:hypothetical protein
MMNEPLKSSTVIELSTVFFCAGPIPRVIALKDCGLALRGVGMPALTGLYGNQSKQDGFMAARDYAEKNRLQFTVIDFLVGLDHRINPGLMKPEEVAQHDFFPFQRLSRGMLDEIGMVLAESEVLKRASVSLESNKATSLLIDYPDLVGFLAADPMLQHIKVIAHQAKPVMSDRVLNVGTVPHRHWSAIREATCRLNPSTRITLDSPLAQDKPDSTGLTIQDTKSKPNIPRPPQG